LIIVVYILEKNKERNEKKKNEKKSMTERIQLFEKKTLVEP